MKRKIIWFLLCGLVLGSVLLGPHKTLFSEENSLLLERLDKISQQLERNQQALLDKINTVLSNQEKILSELEIVKVRASRR